MKDKIHPKYFEHALVKCACGNQFKVGSTKEELHIEICSKCHPFYTGQEKIIDTAGRVERFKAKRAAAKQVTKKKTKTISSGKKIQEEAKKES